MTSNNINNNKIKVDSDMRYLTNVLDEHAEVFK